MQIAFELFSLAYEAWMLLDIDLNPKNGHLATEDTKTAMQFYMKYKDNEKSKEDARRLLLNIRPRMTPTKASNYNYEGICVAGFFKEMCTCNRSSFTNN
ncbi:unnamed protein product [Rotaria sp. Silwood1]|nr:unnamed protein product [Rotaria sp. Silwood1]CAF1182491.1 unnamed protein product [Rotaria sp. Silwood1]CAF3436231.1 unnamed protein product [Rotaria sp. Silwood1]CAF3480838.1 unnamed protein product [Rotaria sp. Silwood1]CAF4886171.1 unnamed protein product [Rotaria sp. Silwood1]